MQELASLVLAADTSQMAKAIEVMDKASLSADKLSEANARLARAGAEASSNRTTKIVDDERKIEEALGKEILAIQRHTVAYERMQAQASRTATSGIRSPQAVSEELAGLSRARDMWEEAGKSAKGYDGALAQIVARESTLIEGNARHRGALRQTAAAMASLAFEAGGAAFLITAVGGALAAPIMPGVGLSKAIEDTRLGMASILISMGRINGIAPTLPQALQISGGMMDKLVNDSMRFGVSIEALANTLRSTLAPGLAAGMNLEQIQKVATIGTIAVKTIGLDSRQTVQEIRDLVAGGIQASSSTLATSLGIKDSDIKRWREAGTLYDELMNKMQGFQIAASENANTLSGSWDILKTKVALLMSSEDGFTAIKNIVIDLSNYVGKFNEVTGKMDFNPSLVASAKAYWETIIQVGNALRILAEVAAFLAAPAAIVAGSYAIGTAIAWIGASAAGASISVGALDASVALFLGGAAIAKLNSLGVAGKGGLLGLALYGGWEIGEFLNRNTEIQKSVSWALEPIFRLLDRSDATMLSKLTDRLTDLKKAAAGSPTVVLDIADTERQIAELKKRMGVGAAATPTSPVGVVTTSLDSKMAAAIAEDAKYIKASREGILATYDAEIKKVGERHALAAQERTVIAGMVEQTKTLTGAKKEAMLHDIESQRISVATLERGASLASVEAAHIRDEKLASLDKKARNKDAYQSTMELLGLEMQAKVDATGKELTNVDKVELAYAKLLEEKFKHLTLAQKLRESTAYGKDLEIASAADIKAADEKAAKTAETKNTELVKSIANIKRQTEDVTKSKAEMAVYDAEIVATEIAKTEALVKTLDPMSKQTAELKKQIELMRGKQAADVGLSKALDIAEITKNFKGVYDGLLEPGVNVFKKIADNFGTALNKSVKEALTKALFGGMGEEQIKSMALDIEKVVGKIKEAKQSLENWAKDIFGDKVGKGVSDAIVLAGTQLFKSFSSQASQAQLNAVNQSYIQQWQGTGTVLGDMSAKSTSIVTALDTLNKTTFGTTDYLAQMTTSMKNVDKGMTSLLTELGKVLGVTGISQTAIGGKTTEKAISDGMAMIGNIIGNVFGIGNVGSLLQNLFGSSSTTITGTGVNFQGTAAQLQRGQGGQQYTSGVTTSESFFGLISSSSTWTQYSALASSVTKALGDIFKNIGDTIKGAAVALGGNLGTLTQQVESFVISTGNISLAGMSVQQQQEALSNIISKQSDLMVAAIVPSMKAFQVAGEGLLQTLVRVVSEFATLTTFYKVLGDTAMVTASSADRLVTALGGVDAANQSMTKFVSNFASEAIKSSLALNALEVALSNAGLKGVAPMIKTTQDYFSLMQVASNEQRVVLLQQQDTALAYIKSISSAFTFMLDQASKFANIAKTEMGFVMNNLSSLASSTKGAAQQMYQAFMQQTSPDYQMQQYRKSLAQITDAYSQYKATGVAPNAASLQQAVGVVSSTSNIGMYATAEDWKRGTLQTIDVLSGMGNLADAQLTILTQISGTMDKLLAASQEQLAATNAGNYAAAADAEKRAAELSVNLKWLEGVNSLLTNSAAQNTLVIDLVSQTVSATNSGNSALIDTLQRYISSSGKTMIGSGATTGAGGSFSSTGTMLPSGTPVGALNQVAGGQALSGFGASGLVNTSVTTNPLASMLPDIKAAGVAAGIASEKAAADAALAKIVATGNDALAAMRKYWDTWPSTDATDTANVREFSSALNTYRSEISAGSGVAGADAIIAQNNKLFAESMAKYAAKDSWFPGGVQNIYAINAAAAGIADLAPLPAFAKGTNFLPSDMIAQVHEGERIIPKADNLQLIQRLQDPQANNEALVMEIRALREEVRQLRESNTAENIASINATQKTAKIIDRWDGDGMPDIRTIGAAA